MTIALLSDFNHVLAQLVELMIGFGLSRAPSKYDQVVAVPVFPFMAFKLDVPAVVYDVIWIWRRYVSKTIRSHALVDKVNRNASDIAHVLHCCNHYWLV